jgi:hypothetical protein
MKVQIFAIERTKDSQPILVLDKDPNLQKGDKFLYKYHGKYWIVDEKGYDHEQNCVYYIVL